MLRLPCCPVVMLLCSFSFLFCHLLTVLECITADYITSTRMPYIPPQTISHRYITIDAGVLPSLLVVV
ncbi:hypothetical protein P691DRAFT_568637 [Macrolepiota fuliginosa MF-IS2]|uniref:Secreted protein n=1 Tax=Macrolepiota fuliginosa MF-IS2 TaxID=1400762 RepID=A0A9P6BXB3_9AGAR|nr:hypothetical protein P691DRAFT_568637 [Macrolepiota fuliginosa MF-IS2]